METIFFPIRFGRPFSNPRIKVNSFHHCAVLTASDKHLKILLGCNSFLLIVNYGSFQMYRKHKCYHEMFFQIFFRNFCSRFKRKKPYSLFFQCYFAFLLIFWRKYELKLVPLLFNFGQINRLLLPKFLVSVKGEDGDLLVLLAEWSLPHVVAGSWRQIKFLRNMITC